MSGESCRELLLKTAVLAGVATVAITETLSLLGAVSRWPVAVSWAAALGVWIWRFRPAWKPQMRPSRDPVLWVGTAGIAAVLAAIAVTAAFSPPNSADAMAYHMPRVVFWAQQHSVRFFPTPYLNQIMLQPFAEYAMLHLFVVTGGDRLINFVQWLGFLGSIVAVSSIAKEFGAPARGQMLAALFCATIPAAVLAASGAKNDLVLAFWLCAAVFFALRGGAWWLGAALGLALLTKGTAYVFAPLPVAAVWLSRRRPRWQSAAVAAGVALLLNLPHLARNLELSGSPLGFDSAHGDGVFRWRNERFGPKETLSNLLRHSSEQLGARGERWNRGVYRAVLAVHGAIGADPNDPATTWRGAEYRAPRNANHEADSPNRWQVLLLLFSAGVAAVRRRREELLYAAALFGSFVLFSGYLKWQPFMSRLLVPLLILAAPLVAGLARGALVTVVLMLFLLSNARQPVTENWVRPLEGPRSVLRTPREEQYFADMSQFGDMAAYRRAAEQAAHQAAVRNCAVVGIDIHRFEVEYPLQAMLRRRRPETRFVHVDVKNASSRYAPPAAGAPCVTVRLPSTVE